MWKLLELKDESFVYRYSEIDDNLQCILFNIKECWSETLSFSEVFQRAKQINKRLIVDEKTLRETLLDKNVTKGTRRDGNIFDFEYRIQNCPFYFEWHMTKQTEEEVRTTIIYPLIEMTDIMCQKINQLCDCLQRKDDEIEQYKIEGAVLERRTKATPRFDLESFKKSFCKISESSTFFKKIAKQEEDFKASRNLNKFETNSEKQTTNEITPEKKRKRKGHKSPHRKMTLRNFNNQKHNKYLAFLETESQSSQTSVNAAENLKLLGSKRLQEPMENTSKICKKKTKIQESQPSPQVSFSQLMSSDENITSIAQRKDSPKSCEDKREKSDPNSEVIIIPPNKSPKKLSILDTASMESLPTTPKKTVNLEKNLLLLDNSNDFDMTDFFTWKNVTKTTSNEKSKSVEEILQELKNLERRQRMTRT